VLILSLLRDSNRCIVTATVVCVYIHLMQSVAFSMNSCQLENGRLLDGNCITTNTGNVISNRICFCCIRENPILCASLQIRQLLTGCITQDDQKAFAPHHPPRSLIIHNTGGGWRGGRRKETVTLYQHPCDTKAAQNWVLATWWCCAPSTSRKWWQQSQLSITLTFLRIKTECSSWFVANGLHF